MNYDDLDKRVAILEEKAEKKIAKLEQDIKDVEVDRDNAVDALHLLETRLKGMEQLREGLRNFIGVDLPPNPNPSSAGTTLIHQKKQVQVQREPLKVGPIKTDTFEGKILLLYSEGKFKGKLRPKAIVKDVQEKWGGHDAAINSALSGLAEKGILVKGKETGGGVNYWLSEDVEFV